MKIAFITSEITPFSKTRELADVSQYLPLALEKLGAEVMIITPKYRSCNVKEAVIGNDVRIRFVQKKTYFDREHLYGDKYGYYDDNLERFSYFSRNALEYLKTSGFTPDIIHCNDWQTSLVPIYLKALYNGEGIFKGTKILLTIHNIAYQGVCEDKHFKKIGRGEEYFNIECLEYYGKINLLKGGIVYSNAINTVSPKHAEEIQTPEFGSGLEGVLKRYRYKLRGILNGIDYDMWDPATDDKIKKNYSKDTIDDKLVNKEDLQISCGLKIDSKIPLAGMVSPLVEQKGIDILIEALDEILKSGVQLVILGTGEALYHRKLEGLETKYAGQVSINFHSDPALTQKIYAGCDIFLMPSKYEPCGLGQMISLRYGTIPVVRETGGLADTISEFNPRDMTGNGFLFAGYNKSEFSEAVRRAAELYKKPEVWRELLRKAMERDFSWENSAREYTKLYSSLKP